MTALSKAICTLAFALVLASSCKKHDEASAANNNIIETIPPVQKPVTYNVSQYIGGYYESLPVNYGITTKQYPLLVFLHGYGQIGDGGSQLPLVLNDGVAKYIEAKQFPASFTVNGEVFSFIVLSPQFRGYPPDQDVSKFLDYAVKKYRVDASRIYLSGLSMGAVLTTNIAGIQTTSLAAVLPISGEVADTSMETKAKNIAGGRLPLWDFHTAGDTVMPYKAATNFISAINNSNPAIPARLTTFPGIAHDAWTKALDPIYKENGLSVYEWMLQYKR